MILYTTEEFAGFPDGNGYVKSGVPVSLISDSHWFWWYVRIIGSGVEQYIPADIVEFPRERIARLNCIANEFISCSPPPLPKPTKYKKRVTFLEEVVPDLVSDSGSDSSPPLSPINATYGEIIPCKGYSELTIHDLEQQI